MKKLFLACFLSLCAAGASFAGGYTLDESAIDNAFANSQDVTLESSEYSASLNAAIAEGETTVGGFLLRSYFCGSIALHRSYMGTGGATLWWKYLCIPIAGGVANCVDFWGVLFKGEERLAIYKDNPNFFAWKK